MAFVLWKELPRKGKARLFVKTGILFLALFNLLTCVPNIPKAHTYAMPKHLASNEQARSKPTISSLTKGEEASSRCPKGFVYMHNRVLSNTHDERFIPKTIHFVLRSKCVPDDLAKSLHQWLVLDDYSIFYHDQEDVDKHIKAVAASRKDFAGVFSAYKCAPNSFAKLDVARFSILWSFGGITLDVDSIPGPAFMNGTIVDATDEFVVEESADPSRFLASAPKHAALYFAILHFTTRISFLYHCYEPKDGNCDYLYPGFRKELYKDFIMGFFHGTEIPVPGNIKTEKFSNPSFMKSKIAHINLEKGGVGQLLLPALNMSNETLHEANLKTLSIHDKSLECDALHKHNAKEDPFEVDIKTLLEVSGITQQHKNTCPEGLTYIGSTFDPKSLLKGRHIPKLVHMTSKTKCFTDAFESNINKWRFDGYSFFMHDDDAVQRLFGRDWPEFPLLQEILSCVDTGAGLADVWRYLVLWEYGGIYTDIDNAPGDLFANGTVIHDQMDSFFEQEREGFPSQYFFAASPHHPVMYHMVQSAIERLLEIPSISGQYVPFTTGPGATKSAVFRTIGGSGYPGSGEYHGLNHRNITVVGSRVMAKNSRYIRRDSVHRGSKQKDKEYNKMNMTHYSHIKRDQSNSKNYSCYMEIYNNNARSDEEKYEHKL